MESGTLRNHHPAVEDLYREIRSQGFEGEFRFDDFSNTLYATDASIYQSRPLAVALPRHPQDLELVWRAALERQLPLLPRGGGTSLAGQTVGPSLCLDFSKYMNRVLRSSPEERWVEVEPGVVLHDLNAQMAQHGLMFAPDPATAEHACVGGVVANNSSGMRSLVYGKTVNHVLDLTVLTSGGQTLQLREHGAAELEARLAQEDAEGDLYRGVINLVRNNAELIVSRFPKILRRVSGYNLDEMLRGLTAVGYGLPPWEGQQAPRSRDPQGFSLAPLVVGSEGSLGLISRARLNLVEKPEASGLLVGHFSGLTEALEGNAALLELKPSACELLDKMVLDLARCQLELSRLMDFLEGQPEAVVIAEFSGTEKQVQSALKKAASLLKKKKLGYAYLPVTEAGAMQRVWRVRKAGLPLLLGLTGERKPVAFIEDTAVAPERLVEYVQRFDAIVRDEGTTAAYYAHASVGCLHIRPLLDLKKADDIERMQRLSDKISDLVVEFGGSMSGEHGDGLARGLWNRKQFGDTLYEVFREVKRLFDPLNLMNPGKVVDSPPMSQSLRYGADYRADAPELALDWSREGGFVTAVELCNGAGVCRKTNRGTMCPSYMVTREEEHSTRGRANLLRAALSGRLPRSELYSPQMEHAFELCIECKACKAECPSGVDVAKMKFEFLAGLYRRRRPGLRTQLFARAELLNRVGCATAPLSNWLGQSLPGRLASRALGIAPQRSLPRFADETFYHWWNRRRPPGPAVATRSQKSQGRRVALFVDTFAAYNEPEIARAAVRVLEAAGFRVELANKVCCGRPAISKGLVKLARQQAEQNFRLLAPYVEAEVPVVGLEPSCILSVRDEYRDLLPGRDLTALAANCLTFEEFMADHAPPLIQRWSRLLLHGHCHQKALVGTDPSHRLLQQLPEASLEEVDSGCCGMAGSFGYEAEHYEVSRLIGERRLFPAVRRLLKEGGQVVAAGTSCRQQINHFTGHVALHPAQVLEAALE